MPFESEKPKSENDRRDEVRRIWKKEGEKDVRVNERSRDPLRVGREVAVRRSSGAVEGGWMIIGFKEGGLVSVQKKEGEETLEKDIPIGLLEELNPPQEGPESQEE